LSSRQLRSLYQCCCTATPCSLLYLPLSRARVSCSVPLRWLVRCSVVFPLALWFQTHSQAVPKRLWTVTNNSKKSGPWVERGNWVWDGGLTNAGNEKDD
jgi:hypothetical protein